MTTLKKLTRREFSRAMKLGHGRALLHLRDYGDEGIEDIIKKAVLTNYAYDVQIEGLRTLWIWQILTLTRRPLFYSDHLQNNFSLPSHRENDIAQQFGLAGLLFDLGRHEFRELMFAKFYKAAYGSRMSYCGNSIVDTSGITGLEHVARTCGAFPDRIDQWDCAMVLKRACELGFEDNIMEHMMSLAKQESSVDTFMGLCDQFKSEDLKVSNRQPRIKQTLAETLKLLQSSPHEKYFGKFRIFGRHATQDELGQVRDLLKQATNERLIQALLSVFSYAPMPVIASDAIDLLHHKNSRVRHLAARALSHSNSSEVKTVALQLLRSGKSSSITLALTLLENNYLPDDSDEIYRSLKYLRPAYDIHSAGMALNRMCEKSGGVELEATMLWMYQNGPDSFCRAKFLKKLVDWQRCPPELLFEAQWDVNSDLQNFARNLLAQHPN